MESEVVAALIGTPAVLVTALAAWGAGRLQGRSTYQGSVDAVRRTSQREAYIELHRTAQQFIDLWETSHASETFFLREAQYMEQIYAAQDALDRAAAMVSLEGPDALAAIAEELSDSAAGFAGRRAADGSCRFIPFEPGQREFRGSVHGPDEIARHRSNANERYVSVLRRLLPEARKHLNGGPQKGVR